MGWMGWMVGRAPPSEFASCNVGILCKLQETIGSARLDGG